MKSADVTGLPETIVDLQRWRDAQKEIVRAGEKRVERVLIRALPKKLPRAFRRTVVGSVIPTLIYESVDGGSVLRKHVPSEIGCRNNRVKAARAFVSLRTAWKHLIGIEFEWADEHRYIVTYTPL